MPTLPPNLSPTPAPTAAPTPAPRVSVVIPAYNVATFLPGTLDSVLAQTLPAYEILVVNDGSPDTPALERALAPYQDRIRYLHHENRGSSAARNTGIRAATGNLIALLDGDDLWLPTYLATQTAFLAQHPELDLVYCNARFFGPGHIHDGLDYMTVCPSAGEPTAAALIARACHVFTSVLARASVLQELLFDEHLRHSEDYDLWLRLVGAGHRIGYHREILVRYRKHPTSLSADTTRMTRANLRVLQKSAGLWHPESTEGRLLAQATARKSAELDLLLGKQALAQRDIPSALTHFTAANRFYQTPKLRAIHALLRHAPALVRVAFLLRGRLSPAHR